MQINSKLLSNVLSYIFNFQNSSKVANTIFYKLENIPKPGDKKVLVNILGTYKTSNINISDLITSNMISHFPTIHAVFITYVATYNEILYSKSNSKVTYSHTDNVVLVKNIKSGELSTHHAREFYNSIDFLSLPANEIKKISYTLGYEDGYEAGMNSMKILQCSNKNNYQIKYAFYDLFAGEFLLRFEDKVEQTEITIPISKLFKNKELAESLNLKDMGKIFETYIHHNES